MTRPKIFVQTLPAPMRLLHSHLSEQSLERNAMGAIKTYPLPTIESEKLPAFLVNSRLSVRKWQPRHQSRQQNKQKSKQSQIPLCQLYRKSLQVRLLNHVVCALRTLAKMKLWRLCVLNLLPD